MYRRVMSVNESHVKIAGVNPFKGLRVRETGENEWIVFMKKDGKEKIM